MTTKTLDHVRRGVAQMTATERSHYEDVKRNVLAISQRGQIDAWMRLFAKVNSIIADKKIPTEAHYGNLPYPAMTDGTTVKFSATWITSKVLNWMQREPAKAHKAVAMLKGINYHEMGHVLFSPNRDNSPYATALATSCSKAGIAECSVWIPANLIEDQRIETLFSAMFSGAKHFFRASTLEAMLKDESDAGHPMKAATAFVFSHGRRFLPRSLRIKYRNAARAEVGDQLVDAWIDMMDEYCTLNLVDDCDRAAELTLVAADLLVQMGVTDPPSTGHETEKPGRKGSGRPNAEKAREASKKAREDVDDDIAKDDEFEENAESGGTSPADEDGEEADEDEEGEGGSGDSDDDESDDDTDGSGDATDDTDDDADESEEAEGKGGSKDSPADEADADTDGDPSHSDEGGYSEEDASEDSYTYDEPNPETLAEALDQLLNDADFMTEVQNMINDFKAEAEKGAVEKPKKERTGLPNLPDAHEVGVTNRLFRILQQMRADAGSNRERQMDHGKINVMDFALRNPWDLDIFEYYEDGREDEFNMEVVILLDMSPSMSIYAQRASLALWQIKLAMQRFDVPVTVYGYNDGNAKCLYAPTDKVTPRSYENFGSGGMGTDPLDALTRAYNILSRSTATRRILVTLTDGAWNANTRMQSDALVERINGLPGAASIIIGLTYGKGTLLVKGDRTTYHQHMLGVEVTDPASVLDVFKEYVLGVGRSVLAGR